jgi:hypothetical protein
MVSNSWRYSNLNIFRINGINADNFSAVYATTPIIFPRCCPQHGKMIAIVGNNASNFSALWATTLKIF